MKNLNQPFLKEVFTFMPEVNYQLSLKTPVSCKSIEVNITQKHVHCGHCSDIVMSWHILLQSKLRL